MKESIDFRVGLPELGKTQSGSVGVSRKNCTSSTTPRKPGFAVPRRNHVHEKASFMGSLPNHLLLAREGEAPAEPVLAREGEAPAEPVRK